MRSSGLLQALNDALRQDGDASPPQLIGDFSLNAANVLTAHTFLKWDSPA
ncbi:MAG: hypothetical protein R2911_41755 [Caldilineaceae bacterium]